MYSRFRTCCYNHRVIYNLKFYVLDCIPQSLRNQGLRFFCIKTFLIMHFWEKNGKLLVNRLACLQNSSTIFMIWKEAEDEVMGRTEVSKKSKYFWKKILILTWMLSLFLGILAGPCAVDAKNQKEKKEYGVFLSIDSSQIKKLYGYRLVVIDAQYFSAKDIRTLHKKGI